MERIHSVLGDRYGEPGEYGNVDEAVAGMVEEMRSCGEGARGNVSLGWFPAGGHSIAWEVENGQVVFRDTQLNTVINIKDYADLTWSIAYARYDDLTPSKKMLKKVKKLD